MRLSIEEILLWDLIQTDANRKTRHLPEQALFGLKVLSEGLGDPQDFGYDAEKWKEWLLIHSPGFKSGLTIRRN
jgi:hypothetical protein